ncbi:hypothetical protein [Winogradskyella thalassocola]|uniref:Uncharacterized protein n=1 Tax=Winogradskyella thalassocola TaxID=262004 RepID=A0A1G8HZK6_9FLAO|nr:hypothetical protein [Winogradskyella thalassocola]SDI12165.1 hypothetical protein SAMN04489796_10792 [Winogradskyella thalassocola]
MRKHKAIRFLMVATVLFTQVTFLTMIVNAHYETNAAIIIAALVIILTIVFGYRYLDLHHEDYAYEKISVVIWVPIGAVLCYLLNIHGGLGSILAMGIVGTLASFIPSLNKKSNYLQQLPASIYCGAFVGMSSVATTPSIGFVLAAGTLAGLFFMISKNLFLGVGGKLGTMAFAGVITATLIYSLMV